MVQLPRKSSDRHLSSSSAESTPSNSQLNSIKDVSPSNSMESMEDNSTNSSFSKQWFQNQGFTEKVKANRRRIAQGLLQTFGRTTASDDTLYCSHRNRFQELLSNLRSIKKHMETYRNTMALYYRTCTNLGNAVIMMIDPESIGKGTDNEKFSHSMTCLTTTHKVQEFTTPDDALGHILTCLDTKIKKLESYKKQLQHREKLKLDYDGYDRKVKNLRNSKKMDPLKIREKQDKKQTAFEALAIATENLLRVFAYYEAQKESFLSNELNLFRHIQQTFFQNGMEAIEYQFQYIQVDEAIIEQKAEEIFEQMKVSSLIKPSLSLEDNQSLDVSSSNSYANENISNGSMMNASSSPSTLNSTSTMLRPPIPKCAPPPPIFNSSMKFMSLQRRHSETKKNPKYETYNPSSAKRSESLPSPNEDIKMRTLSHNSSSSSCSYDEISINDSPNANNSANFQPPPQSTTEIPIVETYVEGCSTIPPPPPEGF